MSSEKVLGDDVILTTPLLRSSQPLSSAEIFQSLVIREGCEKKKTGKNVVFCQTGGGAGSRMVVKCQTAILEKYFFS